MLRNVYFYGALGRKFGYRHRFDITTAPEAISAMSANYPGFNDEFVRGAAYSFIKGPTRREGSPLDLRELPMMLGKNDIHIIPAAYGNGGGGGGGGKGIGKIVLGVAMIAFAVVTAGAGLAADAGLATAAGATEEAALGGSSLGVAGGFGATAFTAPILGAVSYGQIAGWGAMMALSGIAQMISPTPQASASINLEAPDARVGFIYNGPANTAEQGGPVPILYGRMIIGSTLISGSVATDQTNGSVSAGVTGTTARVPFTGGDL